MVREIQQNTSHILMIRPYQFGYNAETAVNNKFQTKTEDALVAEKALVEFDGLVKVLRDAGVDITVIQDTPEPATPDSIFPNNWVSFHRSGTVCLYPMFAPNRRAERKPHILDTLEQKFTITHTVDYTGFENSNEFLEGTGSVVLDRDNLIAYACYSPRTDRTLLKAFAAQLGYQTVSFIAADERTDLIYHTNVMMCVADTFAVVCLESIVNNDKQKLVSRTLTETGKEVITISFDQMRHFAGNMLQVTNVAGDKFLVMSTQAYNSLSSGQIKKLEAHNAILHADLTTIETNGGGSARCMLAEVFLPRKK